MRYMLLLLLLLPLLLSCPDNRIPEVPDTRGNNPVYGLLVILDLDDPDSEFGPYLCSCAGEYWILPLGGSSCRQFECGRYTVTISGAWYEIDIDVDISNQSAYQIYIIGGIPHVWDIDYGGWKPVI